LGRAVLGREQLKQLESDHCGNRATENETGPITDIALTFVRKEEIAIAEQQMPDMQMYTSRY
jgi:hypothetical protein